MPLLNKFTMGCMLRLDISPQGDLFLLDIPKGGMDIKVVLGRRRLRETRPT